MVMAFLICSHPVEEHPLKFWPHRHEGSPRRCAIDRAVREVAVLVHRIQAGEVVAFLICSSVEEHPLVRAPPHGGFFSSADHIRPGVAVISERPRWQLCSLLHTVLGQICTDLCIIFYTDSLGYRNNKPANILEANYS